MSSHTQRDGTVPQLFTDWADVPLVAGLDEAARVLNRSTRAIERDLATGRMRPAPMPRPTPRAPWQWAKSALRRHVDEAGACARSLQLKGGR